MFRPKHISRFPAGCKKWQKDPAVVVPIILAPKLVPVGIHGHGVHIDDTGGLPLPFVARKNMLNPQLQNCGIQVGKVLCRTEQRQKTRHRRLRGAGRFRPDYPRSPPRPTRCRQRRISRDLSRRHHAPALGQHQDTLQKQFGQRTRDPIRIPRIG